MDKSDSAENKAMAELNQDKEEQQPIYTCPENEHEWQALYENSSNLLESSQDVVDDFIRRTTDDAIEIMLEFCSYIAKNEGKYPVKYPNFSYRRVCHLNHKRDIALMTTAIQKLKAAMYLVIESHLTED